jgi:DHA1 family tetracycline resistance protein-like MFS transporter
LICESVKPLDPAGILANWGFDYSDLLGDDGTFYGWCNQAVIPHTLGMPRTRPSLLPILAVNFVGTLGLSIVLPFLVFVVNAWGGNAVVYGIISASYSAFQLVGAPILGRWSDRFGRRRVLLLSQGGTLVSWIIFLVAFYLPDDGLIEVVHGPFGVFTVTLPLIVLLLARSLDGLTGGNVSVANAYLADISSADDRSANFGKLALAANLGFVIGPALAGLLGGTALGYRLPVLAAIVISTVAMGIIAMRLPESAQHVLDQDRDAALPYQVLGPGERECVVGEQLPGKMGLRQVLRIPCVSRLLTTHFLVMLAFHFFYASFPMHAARGLGWPSRKVGIFLAVLSLMMVLVQGPVLSWASRRFREGPLVLFGLMVLAASFWLFGASRYAVLLLAAAGMALGNGLMWPSLLALISKAAGAKDQGVVQGYASSGGALASIFGLVLGGVLFELIGTHVFVLASGIFVAAALVSLSLRSWYSRNGISGKAVG